MPESDELHAAINHLKYKVDSIDKGLEILLRFSGQEMIAEYITKLKEDAVMGRVYLCIDGRRTQQQIAQSVGTSEATVSRRIKKLEDIDLIELDRQIDDGKIYRYTKMERLYKLSKILEKELKE